MTRLTRVESQARTRAQLIATATEVFLRDGYLASSLETVAEAAGYSRGAVYSNFRNKDELCMEVLAGIRAERMAEIASMVTEQTLDARLARFETWAASVVGDPSWTRLELEFAAYASRDPELSAGLAEQLLQIVGLATTAISATADDTNLALPIDARELAVAVLSLGVGLGLFRAIEPSLPVSAMINTVRALVSVR